MKGGLYKHSGNIYPGTNFILTCNPPVNDGIKWTMNGNELQPSDKYIFDKTGLTVNNASPSDSGKLESTGQIL